MPTKKKTKTKKQPEPIGRVMWGDPKKKLTQDKAVRFLPEQWTANQRPHLIIPMTDRAAVVEVMARAMRRRHHKTSWLKAPFINRVEWLDDASAALTALGWPEEAEPKKRRAKR